MAQTAVRVLIVDDQPIVRKGIRALLAEVEDIEVVGEAGDGQEAVVQAETLYPDVILMDLVMPRMDGIEAIRQITDRHEGARILVLTSFAGDDKVFPAIKAGALGYLLKDSEPTDLLRAVRQVYRGESSLEPSIARKVIQEMQRPKERPLTPDPLTNREIEVLRLVAKGLSNPDIAERLGVTEATVRSHVSNILSKLHLANRVQATLYALHEGLVSLEDGLRTEEKGPD
jgi:NarL family two-component system response regulator LiaR